MSIQITILVSANYTDTNISYQVIVHTDLIETVVTHVLNVCNLKLEGTLALTHVLQKGNYNSIRF